MDIKSTATCYWQQRQREFASFFEDSSSLEKRRASPENSPSKNTREAAIRSAHYNSQVDAFRLFLQNLDLEEHSDDGVIFANHRAGCCDGQGRIFDEAQKTYRFCGLLTNLSRARIQIQEICDYEPQFNLPLLQSWLSTQDTEIYELCKKIIKLKASHTQTGFVEFTSQEGKGALEKKTSANSYAPYLATALLMNWFTQINLVCFNLRGTSWQKYFSLVYQQQRPVADLILVFGISELWQADQAWRFEELVAACYQYRLPFCFFIDLGRNPEKRSTESSHRYGASFSEENPYKKSERGLRFHEKVASLKQVKPFSWLSQQCQSQLYEMLGPTIQNRGPNSNSGFSNVGRLDDRFG